MTLRFTVPGEPRGWARARTAGKRFFTDGKTASEKQAVAAWALQAGAVCHDGPVRLIIRAYLRIPRSASKKRQAAMLSGAEYPTKKPDGDNLAKLIGDALTGVCWRDDAQVVDWIIEKRWCVEPRVEIEVSPMLGVMRQSAGSLQNRAAQAA
jgi:Holliday junction resolvase RusA-like endonuclease